jgi:hypothetical protein
MKNFKTYKSFKHNDYSFVTENYSDEERKELADKGFALSDGSFPIKDLKDLKNAIQAYGRAKDQARAAKFIVKRAKALGAEDLIPDTEDFQKSLGESVAVGSAIHDVSTELPAKAIALPLEDDEEENGSITEGTDLGSWNQGGLKGDKNVLVTQFVGPKAIEDFGLGRKCMQINVGMDYVSLNPADIVELKDILKSYKVK